MPVPSGERTLKETPVASAAPSLRICAYVVAVPPGKATEVSGMLTPRSMPAGTMSTCAVAVLLERFGSGGDAVCTLAVMDAVLSCTTAVLSRLYWNCKARF